MKISRIVPTCGLIAVLSPTAHLSIAQSAISKSVTPIAASAPTAVPALVPYTGAVILADSKSATTESSANFQIYKDEVGGEALWAETQTIAIDGTGHYKVQLGATSPNGLPADLFASGEARWLEVHVAGETQQPRVLLVSVPYALKAADATTLGGLPASAFALAGTSTAIVNAASGAVNPNAVTTVTTTGGTANKIAKFSGASTIVNSLLYDNGTDVGIGTTAPTATLEVNGSMTVDGATIQNNQLLFAAAGTATAAAGFNSHPLKMNTSAYNSSTKAAVSPRFQWTAEATGNNTASPNGTLNLIASSGTPALAETGFYFNTNGTIHFAPGQTFPGVAGTITGVKAGTALTGGGTTGTVTLNLDTTKVPLLTSANTYVATQAITTGDLTLGSTFNATSGVIDIGGIPFLHGYSKGNQNVFVGGAGNFTNTAKSTSAVGYGALAALTTGSNNTAVGFNALSIDASGGLNTGIGASAGTTGSSIYDATAIGANAKVGQSNSLVLGQTTSGNPGATFVNVGIGTPTPRSILEASATAAEALGPSLTLTNYLANGEFGGASVDFNTYAPSTTGTYNPSSRIEAFGDGGYGDTLLFESNSEAGAAGPNLGLTINMAIGSNGRVNIGTQDTDSNDYAEQLVATSVFQQGDSEVAAIGAFGGNIPGATDSNGSNGIYAVGGDGEGNAEADFAGDGGDFYGGYTPESSNGPAGYGIYATGGVGGVGVAGYAAYLDGNVEITGSLNGATPEVKIDDPVDPANKYLYHASVASSERLNVYSGNVTTDELGLAIVTLPSWFQAENTDFRYQLTVVDERFAQAVISKRIENNKFTIHTNATNVQVSWQITAVRQDAYAKAHPLIVEQEKPASQRGFYQNPELFGQSKEKQVEWARRPKQMQQMKLQQEARKAALANRSTGSGVLRHQQPESAVTRNVASSAPIVKTIDHP